MKAYVSLFFLIVAVLLAAVGYREVADAGEETALDEAIIGLWAFPVDGYFMGFDEEGRLCYGGSAETVGAKRWCNQYTLEDGIVTETCMGGPEDRNCPLGGGSCKARVDVAEDGQLKYRILHEECNMVQHKVVPPSQYSFTGH